VMQQEKVFDISDGHNGFLSRLKLRVTSWWHRMHLERRMILTTKILKDGDMLDNQFKTFCCERNLTGDIAETTEQFVDHIQEQPVHPTIKAIANMEIALNRLKDPLHPFRYRIEFNQHPFILFDALLGRKPYSLETDGDRYELLVCNSVPGKMVVYPLS